jgi:hypothetical protein
MAESRGGFVSKEFMSGNFGFGIQKMTKPWKY